MPEGTSPVRDPVRDPVASGMNRLSREKSPYLLQHASNPVDWYPWGDEPFRIAAEKDLPVFLSIGYSTCHWCHVMAHESFEDTGIAALLNRHFVSIKVDREERPDIDRVYMAVCQRMTGQGGWPLTVFLTPERKPFYAATYIPKKSRFGMPGLDTILPKIITVWRTRRDDIQRAAEEISNLIGESETVGDAMTPGPESLLRGYADLEARFDADYGGFGRAPKFPSAHNLLFLLRYWRWTHNEHALRMAEDTLHAIRAGGIYDQIGFGVHRYSTDAQWRVPHFEKMLYDQALLVLACTEAYQATKRPEYRTTAEEIIGYVLRDLISPDGAFYSAEDADSPAGEGDYYLWTVSEVKETLGDDDLPFATALFNLSPRGNFCHTEGSPDKNILYITRSHEELAAEFGFAVEESEARVESIRGRLFSVRQNRTRPARDDKILADWNGLFCLALAVAGRAFGEERYILASKRSMQFILSTMRSSDGGLLHRYRDGVAGIPGFADDYAFTIRALIALYEATFEIRFLSAARDLNSFFVDHFLDRKQGGFFTVSDTSETVLVRRKEYYDGAIPSANSVAFGNLVLLSRLTGESGLEELAGTVARGFSGQLRESPASSAWFLAALDFAVGPSHELVISGDIEATETREILDSIRQAYLPSVSIIHRPPGDAAREIVSIAPFTENLTMIDGKVTAYICSGQRCRMPVTEPGKVLAELET